MEELIRKFAKKVNSGGIFFTFRKGAANLSPVWKLGGDGIGTICFNSYDSMVSYMEDEIKSDYDEMVVGKFYLITWHNTKDQYPAVKLPSGGIKYLTTEIWGSATWDSNATTIFDTIRIIKEL